MKKIVWGIGIFISFLVIVFLGLYRFAGPKQYFQAVSAIRSLLAEHVHKAFLAALKSYGQVMTSEQIIAQLASEKGKEN